MSKKNAGSVLVLCALALVVTLGWARLSHAQDRAGQPKYVFLFIGDGTSFPQRNAAEFFRASQEAPNPQDEILRAQGKISKNTGVTTFSPNTKRLTMNTFPAQGISTTYSYNSLITDSSSSGTAIATGHKTRDGVVSMDPDGKVNYTSMAKIAKAQGKKVGIITSVSLDHATPAVFYANQPNRNDFYEIAIQGPKSGFDFFGGGYFLGPKDKKGNGKDTVDVYREYGYHVATDRAGFEALNRSNGKVLTYNAILDPDNALPFRLDRGTENEIALPEFVAKAIELLDNDDGFFIMTEGGKVDWACHANDAMSAILDVIDLDDAVTVAYEFYKKHPEDTLIVVTGDHETGGMTVGFAGTRYDTFLDRITNQQGSYVTFNSVVNELKKTYPNAPTVAQIMPTIREFFGLELYPESEMAALEKAAKDGDLAAIEKLKYALRPYEVEKIERAIKMSWTDKSDRPDDDFYYANYGSYEPLTVAMTQTLNNKAGIGWTTFSHSGLPTPVSAIGVGSEQFVGHYDNTDIFKKIVSIAY
ncbi:MAG: alkaline phosphatase [Planctomycetaceae bacterium]|nr:alkaline phosphatase [Planctomycetaceae bacterium]